jgi:hypothetical protein
LDIQGFATLFNMLKIVARFAEEHDAGDPVGIVEMFGNDMTDRFFPVSTRYDQSIHLITKNCIDVAAAMNHPHNFNMGFANPIENDELIRWQTAEVR